MKLPIAWLRDYIDLELGTDEIAGQLALLGFPVDGIERRPNLSGIVVGRLTKVEKHPNADRLQVCTVDTGGASALTIATAATNVAQGQVVPVAVIGAKLVGLEIAPRTMRGIESEGMLVSAGEIGLADEWFEDGILQLAPETPLGADFVKMYRLEDDVLDVEITANRVDAMSVLGLARELAAAFAKSVRVPDTSFAPAPARPQGSDASITLESPDCKRFVAQRFSNVSVRTAPFWMRVRLALAGQRPINNLVDISNFVMLETGQPLHFYDFEKLAGRRLIVRDARPGETMLTLDGEARTLQSIDLVIADAERAQCLAGLRGAASSEVTEATRELLLEAASFSGPRIRRMSVAMGLRTDASSRHEKGLPLALGELAAARAAHLLQAEGASAQPAFATGAEIEQPASIRVSAAQVHALLGTIVADEEIALSLRGLGFTVAADGDAFVATPPAWRGDIKLREDVIEEVGRITGYDRIGAEQPPILDQAISSRDYHDERRVAHAIAALGYREAVTFALQGAQVRELHERAGVALPGPVVEITNPLSEEQRYMRFSLLPGLLTIVRRHEAETPLRLFEIGHIFHGAPEPLETEMVAWLLVMPKLADEPEWRDAGFLDFKGESLAFLRAIAGRAGEAVSARHDELHPGKTASLLVDGKDAALIGAVDPRLLASYDITSRVYAGLARMNDIPDYRVPRYKPASRYPAIERDLALIVAPEIPAMDIEHAARAGADGVLTDVRVFDEYRGPQVESGKKSIALRVVLQRDDATLTDAEADRHVAAILASLAERCGAKIRA
jgi:phenylalanyl-tRNA synthetase beta chain